MVKLMIKFYQKILSIEKVSPKLEVDIFMDQEGLTKRLFDCVHESNSEYIARIDSGDKWKKQAFKTSQQAQFR